MKNSNRKRRYALLIIAIVFITNAHAQIIYTDVNPDSLISCNAPGTCSDIYNLDINSDGIVDFELRFSFSRNTYSSGTLCAWYHYTNNCYAYPKNLNAIASDSIGGSAKNATSVINSSLSWRDTNTNHGDRKSVV